MDDQAAALQISLAKARFVNVADVTALLVECVVIPEGGVKSRAAYAFLVHDRRAALMAEDDILAPRCGGEMVTNRLSVLRMPSVRAR